MFLLFQQPGLSPTERGEGVVGVSLPPSWRNLLLWKRMGRSVGLAGPQLQNRVELKSCFFSTLSEWYMLPQSVQLHFRTWCALC